MMKLINLLFTTYGLCFCCFPTFGQQTTGLSRQLAEKVIPITTHVSDSTRNYTGVAEALKSYRLIGLGESSHGTKDFSDAKAAIIMALVESGDLKTVFFETEYAGFASFNDFLHDSDRRDTEEAFRQSAMYGIYKSEEILSLLGRLKTYNLSHSRDDWVSVYGIDMQHTYETARRIKRLVTGEMEPQYLSTLTTIDTAFWSVVDRKAIWDNEANEALVQRLTTLAATEESWELEFCTLLLKQSLELLDSHVHRTPIHRKRYRNKRDQFMAANILWLQERVAKAGSAAFWAHNGHVTYTSYGGNKRAGSYLKDRLGSAYYPVALAFGEGKVSMVNREIVSYPAVTKTSAMEYLLKNVEGRDFFLDFSSIRSVGGRLARQLSKFHHMRVVGAVPEKEDVYRFRSFKGFDGIIFLHSTSASVKLSINSP